MISAIVCDARDTVLIIAIVLLNAGLGFIKEYSADRALQSLKALAPANAIVMRDGRRSQVPVADIVPGNVFFAVEAEKWWKRRFR